MALSFDERVWELASLIPRGKVSTYRELARALGTKAYRAVGNALNRNPHWPRVPCHRVVRSSGEIGGFASGTRKKAALLRKEGVAIRRGKVVNIEHYLASLRKP